MTQREPLVLNFEQSEWDVTGCEDLAKLLKPTYTHPNVILDLTPVTYMDANCLRELARMQAERAKRVLLPVHLVVASPHIRRVFKLVQFDRVWPLYGGLESALAAARGFALAAMPML
jgi:anti-anti-sigma regulatory factor